MTVLYGKFVCLQLEFYRGGAKPMLERQPSQQERKEEPKERRQSDGKREIKLKEREKERQQQDREKDAEQRRAEHVREWDRHKLRQSRSKSPVKDKEKEREPERRKSSREDRERDQDRDRRRERSRERRERDRGNLSFRAKCYVQSCSAARATFRCIVATSRRSFQFHPFISTIVVSYQERRPRRRKNSPSSCSMICFVRQKPLRVFIGCH